MGVLQRFERRLEGLVEGAFAKVFRGGVEPVEVAKALQREAADRKAISAKRTMVPNHYVVELGKADYARLSPYAEPLGAELAAMVREEAAAEHWQFVGPVVVDLELHEDIDTGIFRVRSAVEKGDVETGELVPRRGQPRVVIARSPGTTAHDFPLTRDVVVIGRGADTDLRLADVGVSRRHGEIRLEADDVVYVDLGSTNGSQVNGHPVERRRLVPGDKIEIGSTLLVFQRDER